MRPAAMFALVTAAAVALSAAVVAVVLFADFLDVAAEAVVRVMFAHGFIAAAAAASPFVAFLLVGYAYMQRGIKKRAAAKAATLARGTA